MSSDSREFEAAFMRLRVRAAEYDDADLTLVLDELIETRVDRAEAERVLLVISGWNPDRVDVATAIQPAAAYLASKDLRAKETARGL